MFERKSGVFLLAGLGFFALAFLSNGLVPWLMYAKLPEQTVEDTIEMQLTIPNADKITDITMKFTASTWCRNLDCWRSYITNLSASTTMVGGNGPTINGSNRQPTRFVMAVRFTSPRGAGIATANLFGRCRMRKSAGDRCRKAGSTRTSCNGP